MAENHSAPNTEPFVMPTDPLDIVLLDLRQMRAAGTWHIPTMDRVIESVEQLKRGLAPTDAKGE